MRRVGSGRRMNQLLLSCPPPPHTHTHTPHNFLQHVYIHLLVPTHGRLHHLSRVKGEQGQRDDGGHALPHCRHLPGRSNTQTSPPLFLGIYHHGNGFLGIYHHGNRFLDIYHHGNGFLGSYHHGNGFLGSYHHGNRLLRHGW